MKDASIMYLVEGSASFTKGIDPTKIPRIVKMAGYRKCAIDLSKVPWPKNPINNESKIKKTQN
jgi:hypothetical protein